MALNQTAGITFRYRAELKIGMGIGAVMLLFFSAFLLLEGLTLDNLIMSGFFLVMLIIFGLVFLRNSGTLTIDEQGVRCTNLFGGETGLAWGEITLYRAGVRRELVLVDSLGGNKVHIHPELAGFEQAIEMVRERRRDLWRQPGGIYELRPNWLLLAVPLVAVFLVSLVLLVSVSSSSSADIFFFVGLFLVIMLARQAS